MADIIRDDAGALLRNAQKVAGDFGKFYTPQGLCRLLARLVAHGRVVNRVLDPACGCAAMLVYVREILGDAFYVGQEISHESCKLARKNMSANGCERFEIVEGDTLATVGAWSEKFDVVVANPPYSVPWNPDAVPFDPRFGGVLAPRSKADLAFVQHGLHWLRDGGKAAYILFPGSLYRGGAEAKIRAQFLPFVRAVVALPGNAFESTSISTVCVVFEKTTSSDGVFFLDASDFCEKRGKQNVVSDEQIEKICSHVEKREIVANRSALIARVSVAANDFNLSPTAYIEKEVKNDNPYAGQDTLTVIEDGEAWARYSYYKQMQALAIMRQAMGYAYDETFLNCNCEAMRPATFDAFSK